jgi:hypothetical protein
MVRRDEGVLVVASKTFSRQEIVTAQKQRNTSEI